MNSNVMMQKLVLIAPLVARAVLYVLIGLSVLSIGVIIERWWYFRRRRDDLDALSDALRKALARGDLAAARKMLAASTSVEAEIIGEALDWYADGPEAVEQILVKATRAAAEEVRVGPAVPGHAGQQRAVHRPVRHRARHRDRVPRARRQPDGRRDGQRHGRHRRGAAGDRGRHPGRAPGRHLLQRVPEEGRRHRGGRGRARQRRPRVDEARTAKPNGVAPPARARRARWTAAVEPAGRTVEVEA